MFIKINRQNRSGETKEVLLDTTKVIAITEIHTEGQNLYNEDGDLVKTENAPQLYRVALEGTTMEIVVDKANYDTLAKELTK